jgi:N utilization substance protein B
MSRSDRAPRQRSRQAALQTLYARDFADPEQVGSAREIEALFERVAQNFDLPAGARDFALKLVRGTASDLEQIDELLAANATNWKISRMAAVDRNVLRLGIYELTRTETPVSVILDEAIQLARRFGGGSSPGFVNGVLDAIAKQVRAPLVQARAPDAEGGRESGQGVV